MLIHQWWIFNSFTCIKNISYIIYLFERIIFISISFFQHQIIFKQCTNKVFIYYMQSNFHLIVSNILMLTDCFCIFSVLWLLCYHMQTISGFKTSIINLLSSKTCTLDKHTQRRQTIASEVHSRWDWSLKLLSNSTSKTIILRVQIKRKNSWTMPKRQTLINLLILRDRSPLCNKKTNLSCWFFLNLNVEKYHLYNNRI